MDATFETLQAALGMGMTLVGALLLATDSAESPALPTTDAVMSEAMRAAARHFEPLRSQRSR